MAGVLRMLFVVFCPLILSESGDDDWPEKEVTCTSTLTFKQSNLTCSLNDEPNEEVKFATLCKEMEIKTCTNATPGPQDFTFENLTLLINYKLKVHTGEGVIVKDIELRKIVKIPAPRIKLATYTEDTEEVSILFEHSHEYVTNPDFQVEIWGDKLANKPIMQSIEYKSLNIHRDRFGGDGVYYTRVRAKPINYFDGDWSEWSSTANFTIKTNSTSLSSLHITIGFSVFLVLIISLGALLWRTHIKDYITPNIPHPKATLAQMHRAREGLPFTFSPEIFSDVFIHCVDYVDEKPSALEFEDGLDECCYSQTSSLNTSLSEMDMNDERLPRKQSHLKIRLLDESDLSKGRENSVHQGETAPQRECKDEAYVTMSSLFKTQ
ncbi:interleukin-7 receptor subunit alpha [Rhinichthys klamathensis goyatoka]|uniref:interleukin-7 receptor subunit alpha n=1 Tax=Rhinichthys klamathensis goyatoka TaxID=3034132 RepID=UPI0024B59DCD|nr:interleukin-7 receptor subunit alpha [Rhinichthys klamathensis goyatoka]